jgi:hypothetical protein
MSLAVKPIVRADRRVGDAEIHAERSAVVYRGDVRQQDDDMQEPAPVAVDQVGGGDLMPLDIRRIGRQGKGQVQPPLGRREIDRLPCPVHTESMSVVPWWAGDRLRTTGRQTALLPSDGRVDRLRGFLAGLNMQVRDERRVRGFAVAVGQMMQRIGIAIALLPPHRTDVIKRGSKLRRRLIQGSFVGPRGI